MKVTDLIKEAYLNLFQCRFEANILFYKQNLKFKHVCIRFVYVQNVEVKYLPFVYLRGSISLIAIASSRGPQVGSS